MVAAKLHADEVDVDHALVQQLVSAQFPRWTALPLSEVKSAGTDNYLYRLGNDMAVKLPRYSKAALQAEKEHIWLPLFAAKLPLAIPDPLAQGEPGLDYPFRWSVNRWIDGENAIIAPPDNLQEAAKSLAGFIAALQAIDPAKGPLPGEHNFGRGVPLAERDERVRTSIQELGSLIDAQTVMLEWEKSLHAPVWDRPPVWIHGDIHAGNLIVKEGKVRAVIDFGGLCVGDPACEMILAWNMFDRNARATFREALNVDDATWARGRGWALSVSLIALPYYLHTNPVIVESSWRMIEKLLTEPD